MESIHKYNGKYIYGKYGVKISNFYFKTLEIYKINLHY